MTFQNPATNVRVELGYTKNLGNFENLKISIAVEDFVREGETVDTATERVYAFVEDKVVQKVTEMESELKNGQV